MHGLFLNPTVVPCFSAWEKVWSGGGWRWQSWLSADQGLAESTCFLGVPEPDWLRVQVAGICLVPCNSWEDQWEWIRAWDIETLQTQERESQLWGSFQRTVLRVSPTGSQVWMALGSGVLGLQLGCKASQPWWDCEDKGREDESSA